MSKLIKIRGLDRGNVESDSTGTSGYGGVLSRGDYGFRIKSGYSPISVGGTVATASGGSSTSQVTVTAIEGGTWANGFTVDISQGGSGTGTVTTTYASSTGIPTFTVTGGAGMTAAQAAAALNNSSEFSQYMVATYGSTGAGTTLSSPGALASGANNGPANQNEVLITGGELYVTVCNQYDVVVDMTDPSTARTLRRNYMRYVALGEV